MRIFLYRATRPGDDSPSGEFLEHPHTFLSLDALRGAAAIAVICFHYSRFFGLQIFPHGYLAVDFFFMLSGFVLTYAYQQKLDGGWKISSFLQIRLIRLYPLYLLGLSSGVLFKFVQDRFGHMGAASSYGTVGSSILLILGLILLPTPPQYQPGSPESFSYNPPSWSLLFELIANIFHAHMLRKRSTAFLFGVLAISGALLAYSVAKIGDLNFGAFRSETLYGLTRVIFPYTAGMLLFRCWKCGRVRLPVYPLIPILLLLGCLMLPLKERNSVVLDLFLVMIVFPGIILISAASQTPTYLVSTFKKMGEISYAVYVLHAPLGLFFEQVWVLIRKKHDAMQRDAPWSGILYLLMTIALALILDRIYDQPLRALIKQKILRRS